MNLDFFSLGCVDIRTTALRPAYFIRPSGHDMSAKPERDDSLVPKISLGSPIKL